MIKTNAKSYLHTGQSLQRKPLSIIVCITFMVSQYKHMKTRYSASCRSTLNMKSHDRLTTCVLYMSYGVMYTLNHLQLHRRLNDTLSNMVTSCLFVRYLVTLPLRHTAALGQNAMATSLLYFLLHHISGILINLSPLT